MCGISGFVSRTGWPLNDLRNMTTMIRHRGPDDEGYALFSEDGAEPICLGGNDTPEALYRSSLPYGPTDYIKRFTGTNAKVGFGHRRLSILDLSVNGHQPLCTSDGRYWIIYNGEIYNYLELRDELGRLGHTFLSDTDTEVILAAYAEWGTECLQKFFGMWAFSIFDRETNELFMARDRFGIKPLYYWFSPEGNLYYGSEIKQFTTCSGWSAKVNSQRAYDYLLYSLTDHTEETMFRDVYHLPAGHFIKRKVSQFTPGKDGKLTSKKWYFLDNKSQKIPFGEACEEFERLFKRSVRRHLHSDVPVGSALSGGLDSSAIVCEINNILKLKGRGVLQKTFSSIASNENYSEKKWMDIVIEQLNVDAYFSCPEINGLLEQTETVLWHQDEPYQSQSAFLGFELFRLSREKGVKVLLNGQGADEYLAGYGQLRAPALSSALFSLRWSTFFAEMKSNELSYYRALTMVANSAAPRFLKRWLRLWFGNDQDISYVNATKLGASISHPYELYNYNLSQVSDISALNLFHNPLPRYLRWEDRNSMAHSVEARVPFLDHELVEFTCSLKPEYLYHKGVTKRVMRSGLSNILPQQIAQRKDKKGFITPEEEWVKLNPRYFREKIDKSIQLTGGIIDSSAIDYFDLVAEGKKNFDYTYWRLISFGEWVELFEIQLD